MFEFNNNNKNINNNNNPIYRAPFAIHFGGAYRAPRLKPTKLQFHLPTHNSHNIIRI